MERRIVRGVELAFDWLPPAEPDAQLVVFIHGVGADRGAWKQQLLPFHEAGFAVAAIDMRGSGDSQSRTADGLAVPISIFEYAADIDALIRQLGFERAHWVGNSMGGVIVLEALDKHYQTVQKAVLCNTFAKHPSSAEILPRAAKALSSKSLDTFAHERIPLTLKPDTSPDVLQDAIYAMARKDVECYLASWRATWSPDYRGALAGMQAPALVVVGSNDALTPPALGEEIAAGIPGSRLISIEGAGHLSNVDAPEQFNHEVIAFLRA